MRTPDPAGLGSPSGCRAREVLDRVGDKWSLYVIHLLGGGTRRFSDLRRLIDGISQRMLTVTLRGLERDGLITRTVHPTVPPRVDYALTPMGRTLLDTVRSLVAWADQHLPDIDAARAAYDRRSALLSAALNGHPEPTAPHHPADDAGGLHQPVDSGATIQASSLRGGRRALRAPGVDGSAPSDRAGGGR